MVKKAAILFLLFFLSCAHSGLHRDKFIVLGTYLEVVSQDERAAGIVHEEFLRLGSVFNKYDNSSELYRLNNSSGREVEVSLELRELVAKSKKYHELTNGAFDISKGKLYSFWKEWGQSKSGRPHPEPEKIEDLKNLGQISGIRINHEQKTIFLKEGVNLDLGGVAKGYIVDQAVNKLKEAGIESALINAGGDLYCLGKNGGTFWQVGIGGVEGEIVKAISLADKAMATSGNYQQFYQKEGKNYSHLIDPRSGYPVERKLSGVTVVADSSWEADLLATAFFIKGKEFSKNFLIQNPSIKAYWVSRGQLEILSFNRGR